MSGCRCFVRGPCRAAGYKERERSGFKFVVDAVDKGSEEWRQAGKGVVGDPAQVWALHLPAAALVQVGGCAQQADERGCARCVGQVHAARQQAASQQQLEETAAQADWATHAMSALLAS